MSLPLPIQRAARRAIIPSLSALLGLSILAPVSPGEGTGPAKPSAPPKPSDCCEAGDTKTSKKSSGSVRAPATLLELSTTPWLEASARSKAFPSRFVLSNQDGKKFNATDLLAKPIAVSFIYTRCKNPNKCPLVANTLGTLQKELYRHGLDGKVHLVLMTYDPENDSPQKLRDYGTAHGLRPSATTHLLRPEPSQKKDFFDALDVAVNFNGYEVNIHGIQLLLFDRSSRFVRSYHSVIWDNDMVVKDLAKLLEEP